MLMDGDAKVACQTACPTHAIVFGNAYDNQSEVAKMKQNNPERSFYVLEPLHVLPNITYFAKVRNSDEDDKNWYPDEEFKEGNEANGLPASTKPEVN